jgi:hypothetical protein
MKSFNCFAALLKPSNEWQSPDYPEYRVGIINIVGVWTSFNEWISTPAEKRDPTYSYVGWNDGYMINPNEGALICEYPCLDGENCDAYSEYLYNSEGHEDLFVSDWKKWRDSWGYSDPTYIVYHPPS